MNRCCLYPLVSLLLGVLILSTSVCAPGPPQPEAPIIISLTTSPGEINPGQWTTLEWKVSGATSVTIQPGIRSPGPSGSLKLSPAQTTTYELTATNEAGSATSSVTVTVIPVVVGKPDLVITDIFGYDKETLYYKIKNQGNADAGLFKTYLYVPHLIPDYGFVNRPRAIDRISSLAAGEEITATFPNLDLSYDPFIYRVFKICADVENAVDESDESNNCLEDDGL